MNQTQSHGYSVTVEISSPWEKAFEYLKEPLNLGKWAFGCWDIQSTDTDDIFLGTSLFDGEKAYVEIEANKHLRIIDFLIGDLRSRQPRISIRIVPGSVYGNTASYCLLTIDAWRDCNMNDERWHRLCVSHETEMLLLKALIERE